MKQRRPTAAKVRKFVFPILFNGSSYSTVCSEQVTSTAQQPSELQQSNSVQASASTQQVMMQQWLKICRKSSHRKH